jgi:hypothetical protein
MKRIIKLTESDLTRIVRRIIKETEENDISADVTLLDNKLKNKTVNLYTDFNEKENNLLKQVTIQRVGLDSTEETPRLFMRTSNSMDLKFQCGDNFFTSTKYSGTYYKDQKKKIYNKELMGVITSGNFCKTKRDGKGDFKTVPNADFADNKGGIDNRIS